MLQLQKVLASSVDVKIPPALLGYPCTTDELRFRASLQLWSPYLYLEQNR